jgi:short-subunit dehydrogenase involved in D-alanine esterification of teichoic acids
MPGIDDCKCILLIGGTSGIGQALAYALHDLPSKPTVIVGGRRKERLDEMKRERLETVQVDIAADASTLKKFSEELIAKYPDVCPLLSSLLESWLDPTLSGRRSSAGRRHPARP